MPDSENSKRKLQTDRQKLMLLEPSVPSRRVKDRLVTRRDVTLNTNKTYSVSLKMLVRDSSSRENNASLSKPSKRETSSSALFRNKKRLKSKRDALRKKRKKSSRSILSNYALRSTPTTRSPSKTGSITSRRVAKFVKKLTKREERSRQSSTRSSESSINLTSPRNTQRSSQRRRSHSEECVLAAHLQEECLER